MYLLTFAQATRLPHLNLAPPQTSHHLRNQQCLPRQLSYVLRRCNVEFQEQATGPELNSVQIGQGRGSGSGERAALSEDRGVLK